jgi:hypothetical protein
VVSELKQGGPGVRQTARMKLAVVGMCNLLNNFKIMFSSLLFPERNEGGAFKASKRMSLSPGQAGKDLSATSHATFVADRGAQATLND